MPRAKPFQSKRLGGRSCTQITMSVCLLLLIGIGEPTKVAITAIEATITVQQTSSQKQEIVEAVEELPVSPPPPPPACISLSVPPFLSLPLSTCRRALRSDLPIFQELFSMHPKS